MFARSKERSMKFASMARLAVVVPVLALAGCGQSQQQQGAAPPPPTVAVAKPVQRTVVDQDEYVGRFVALNSVDIRSRLSGYLA
ncbi:MAG TPA: efflux transporter periplasmic adaptor subunit, partial [Xanthobacteraceae bacterium]